MKKKRTDINVEPKPKKLSSRVKAVQPTGEQPLTIQAATESAGTVPRERKRAPRKKAEVPASPAVTGAISASPGDSPATQTRKIRRAIAEKKETPIEMPDRTAGASVSAPRLPTPPPAISPPEPKLKEQGAGQPEAPIKSPAASPPLPKLKFEIPRILFEGDEPLLPPESGPGRKFAIGPVPSDARTLETERRLQQRLASGKVTLVPRDPHCVFVSWDLTDEQQQSYVAEAAQRQFLLRLRLHNTAGPIVHTASVTRESRHWFVPVAQAGETYIAELGFYLPDGAWISLATSAPARTPSATASQDRTVRFAEMPPPARPQFSGQRQPPLEYREPIRAVAPAATDYGRKEERRAPARQQAPSAGFATEWTAAQERALDEIISAVVVRQEWFDSFQLVEVLEHRRGGREVIQGKLAEMQFELPGPSSAELISVERAKESVSSPSGVEERAPDRGFWFNVNAELIIYGATEPTARVTIGGRQIKLRPDGTFSYRFALPDGQFELPAEATSVDEDRRRAELRFSRHTTYAGEVRAHPQDKELKIPAAENVA
jgi:hypothetical protein